MKILWINTGNNAIAFWRLEQMAQYIFHNWREKSPLGKPIFPHVEYFFNPDSNLAWDHYIQYKDVDDNAKLIYDNLEAAFKHFDIIICQALGYKHGLYRLMELKQKYGKVLLMDVDDCFDEINPSNHSKYMFKDHFNVQAKQAVGSDGIITTNRYFAEKLSKYNNNIFVLPNAVNEKLWLGKKPTNYKMDYVDYAYVAAGSHDEDLKIIYRAMKRLLDKDFKFSILYSSYKPTFIEDHPNLKFENLCVHISKFYQSLLDVNCGKFLAPLRDTEFNRCKSDIKIQEAHMCGKQIICSDVGPYKNHNPMYLTSNDTDDWVNILKKHKNDPVEIKLSEIHKIENYAEDFILFLDALLNGYAHKTTNE